MFYESLPNDLPFVHIPFERNGNQLLLLGTYPGLSEMSLKLPRFGVRLVPGIAGRAAHFDWSNQPIYSDWTGILGNNPRTVCAWIRHPAELGYRQYQSIIGWGDPTIGNAAKSEMLLYRPYVDSPTLLRFSFDQFLYTGTTPMDDGQWHHVAAVFRGPGFSPEDAVTLYVDGELEKLSAEHSNLPTDRPPPSTQPRLQPVLIGCTPLPDSNRGFFGDIDEVYVFQAALKPDRIRDLASRR
jgi:hypothetical protein